MTEAPAQASSAFETKAWLQYYPEWTKPNLDYGTETLLDSDRKSVV